MTKTELQKRLEREGVDPTAYSLDGGTNWYDAYCLDQAGQKWVVYFAERGEQQSPREFSTESAACEYLLEWILKDPTTRYSRS